MTRLVTPPSPLQMPINASNALTLAHQLRVYTAEAANFSDMMDVIYVAQMIEKFIAYVDQIKQVGLSPRPSSLSRALSAHSSPSAHSLVCPSSPSSPPTWCCP